MGTNQHPNHTNQHPNHTNHHPNHTTMNTIAVIVLLVAASSALPQNFFRPQNQNQRQFEPQPAPVDYEYEESQGDFVEPLGLSSGAFELFGNIDTSFSCDGRIYGYYANEEFDCKILHVCQPMIYLMDPRRPSGIISSVPTPPCSISPSSPASMWTSPFPARRLRTSSFSMKISVLSPGMNLNNYKYYLLHCPKK